MTILLHQLNFTIQLTLELLDLFTALLLVNCMVLLLADVLELHHDVLFGVEVGDLAQNVAVDGY